MKNYLIIITIFFALSGKCLCQEKNKQKIEIKSDNLDIFFEQKEASFYDNVLLKGDDFEISSDNLKIYYTRKNISYMTLNGKVKLQTKNQEIYADKCTYDLHNQIIKFSNNVHMHKDNNIFYSNLIIFDLKNYMIKSKNIDSVDVGKRSRLKIKIDN